MAQKERDQPLVSIFKKMAAIAFLRALKFDVVECDVSVAQVRALETVYFGRDVIGVLPIGYGRYLIFHLIPVLIRFKRHTMSSDQIGERGDVKKDSVVIVVVIPRTTLVTAWSSVLLQLLPNPLALGGVS